jgi:hypothetical protein
VRSRIPETFEAQLLTAPDGQSVAHLTIKDFSREPEEFTAEFARLLMSFERSEVRGLILDLRGNPGGDIRSAERSLQFLTPRRIRPALFHYVNSPLTQEIAEIVRQGPITKSVQARIEFRDWAEDLANAVASADAITSGRTTTPEAEANDVGQIFQRPVLLLIDASVYSAAEIFAGGFIDHEIGKVMGVAQSTGGGGANRWDHEELVMKLGGVPGLPLSPLPGGSTLRRLPRKASIAVAVRRSSRVGKHAGEPIEDVGLRPDFLHVTTLADVLDQDRDLLRAAIEKVVEQPLYRLTIDRVRPRKWEGTEGLEMRCRVLRVAKVEAWVDGELIGAVWPGQDGRDLEAVTELVALMPVMRQLRPAMKRVQFLGYNRQGVLCAAAATSLERAAAR